MKKRGKDMELLKTVTDILLKNAPLPREYKDHALGHNLSGYRDCHIDPDWLLIYAIQGDSLYLSRTGSHSDLFG